MNAISFKIRLNSLYSIRIPYTWQSALVYPILPPSAVIGLLANALQRWKNDKRPMEYLDEVEKNVEWAGAKLLSPAVIKSYTTSALTNWEVKLGGKSTNALGRQYGFAKNMEITVAIKDRDFIEELIIALQNSPIVCGDSESIATIEEISPILKCEEREEEADSKIETFYPFPFDFEQMKLIDNSGSLYMVHERCKKKERDFPLRTYIFPLEKREGIYYPVELSVEVKVPVKVIEIERIGKKVIKSNSF